MAIFETYIDGNLKFVRASYRQICEARRVYLLARPNGTFTYRLVTVH